MGWVFRIGFCLSAESVMCRVVSLVVVLAFGCFFNWLGVDADSVHGGWGSSDGCLTTGPCQGCVPSTCTSGTVNGVTWSCLSAGGTSGCSLAGGFDSKCVTTMMGGGCTEVTAPAIGSCGTRRDPAPCPTNADGSCSDTILPACAAGAAGVPLALCDVCD